MIEPGEPVVYVDPSPSGLSSMLGGLIEQNLARAPERRGLLKPAVYTIEAPDAHVTVTLRVSPDRVRVADGADPTAHVRITADSARLLSIAAAPLRFGLPDLQNSQGRRVIADILCRRVRIVGLLRHPVLVSRLTALLSAR